MSNYRMGTVWRLHDVTCNIELKKFGERDYVMQKILNIALLILFLVPVPGKADPCSFLHKFYDFQSKLNPTTFNFDQYLKLFDKLSLKDSFKLDFRLNPKFDPKFAEKPDCALFRVFAYPDTITLNRWVNKEMQREIMFFDSMKENNIIKSDPGLKSGLYLFRASINYNYSLLNAINREPLLHVYPHLQPEKSEEGYLQYLIFYLYEIYGTRSCIYGLLQRSRILCTWGEITQEVDKMLKYPLFNVPGEAWPLKEKESYPSFEIFEDKCIITVIIQEWGSIWERKYSIDLNTMNIEMIGQKGIYNNAGT